MDKNHTETTNLYAQCTYENGKKSRSIFLYPHSDVKLTMWLQHKIANCPTLVSCNIYRNNKLIISYRNFK